MLKRILVALAVFGAISIGVGAWTLTEQPAIAGCSRGC